MKHILICCAVLFLYACKTMPLNEAAFKYKEIKAGAFTLASWQKITDNSKPFKIYAEGDGRSFNARGFPTSDPTPKSRFMRNLAFGDPSPNVIYIARPCQFIKTAACTREVWTNGRFSAKAAESLARAIGSIAHGGEVVLTGYSGGAALAGLAAVRGGDFKIKKIITVAGNLDHAKWTAYHKLAPLDKSLNLADYKEIYFTFPQIHFAGEKDKVIPPFLIKDFAGGRAEVTVIKNAAHNKGFENAAALIYAE